MLIIFLGLLAFLAGMFTGDGQWFGYSVILFLLGSLIELLF